MKLLKTFAALSVSVLLFACGGGGGNPGTSSGAVSPGSGSTPGVATPTPTLKVQVFKAASPIDKADPNVTFGGGNYVKATFTDGKNFPIANRLVNFSLNGATIATIEKATALTNESGEARVNIAPASGSAAGAATVTVQATEGASTYSSSSDFAVSAASVTLSTITLGNSTLSPGANTAVSLTASSNSVPVAGANVALTADCGTISNLVTTDGSGLASATYSALRADGTSCSGDVTLSATAVGTTSRTVKLTVATVQAEAINFMSASPSQVFVKGSGAAEQSIVKFKVLDSIGAAMPNIPVVFSLLVNPGGVGLGASGVGSNKTVNSDAQGVVSLSVFAGTLPGPVEIKAELESSASVFTTTKNLSVASGPPSQKGFSLTASTTNIEGWSSDGASTNLTVRVADRQGNPVPDDTVVNFTAEGGQVQPYCTTKRVNGVAQCSVAFISQNPRPLDGRVSVLAYAEGLRDFTDINGNNVYDAGLEVLVPLGDAYRDDDEDGAYNAGEFVIARSGAESCSGTGMPFPSRANTCTAVQAATVRQQTVLVFSSSTAAFTPIVNATNADETFVSVRVNSIDNPLLPMPAGTVISATALSSLCTIVTVSPTVVPNQSAGRKTDQLGSSHTVGLSGCKGTSIVIKATTPGGAVTDFLYSVPL